MSGGHYHFDFAQVDVLADELEDDLRNQRLAGEDGVSYLGPMATLAAELLRLGAELALHIEDRMTGDCREGECQRRCSKTLQSELAAHTLAQLQHLLPIAYKEKT